ncbi:MAG: hypothetical protein K2M50_04500 [Treponemataceae bacterium]|nr:hypothetical protein [Treponemataceae bacterium]
MAWSFICEIFIAYDGYFCSVKEAVVILVLGSLCDLRNARRIHEWAATGHVREFLRKEFGIERIPCYWWLLSLLAIVTPDSLNRCMARWVSEIALGLADKIGEEEWHYYISSRKLTAEELLHYARNEWSVETMHWLMDVHFGEDGCRDQTKTAQQNLNMVRKLSLNIMRIFKRSSSSKEAMTTLMFKFLMDPSQILAVLGKN